MHIDSTPTPKREFLTVAQVSEETGFSKGAIYKAIKAKTLRAVVPNGCVRGRRIERTDLNDWIDRSKS